MKEKITYLETSNGIKYPLIFTLNVMEEIQDEYESLEKWMDLIKANEPNIIKTVAKYVKSNFRITLYYDMFYFGKTNGLF